MMVTNGNTLHIIMSRMYYSAKQCVRWNEYKYGSDARGSSINITALKRPDIKYYVLVFKEDGMRYKVTKENIQKYLADTPNALSYKNYNNVVIIPLSICKKIDNNTDYFEVDINQFQ